MSRKKKNVTETTTADVKGFQGTQRRRKGQSLPWLPWYLDQTEGEQLSEQVWQELAKLKESILNEIGQEEISAEDWKQEFFNLPDEVKQALAKFLGVDTNYTEKNWKELPEEYRDMDVSTAVKEKFLKDLGDLTGPIPEKHWEIPADWRHRQYPRQLIKLVRASLTRVPREKKQIPDKTKPPKELAPNPPKFEKAEDEARPWKKALADRKLKRTVVQNKSIPSDEPTKPTGNWKPIPKKKLGDEEQRKEPEKSAAPPAPDKSVRKRAEDQEREEHEPKFQMISRARAAARAATERAKEEERDELKQIRSGQKDLRITSRATGYKNILNKYNQLKNDPDAEKKEPSWPKIKQFVEKLRAEFPEDASDENVINKHLHLNKMWSDIALGDLTPELKAMVKKDLEHFSHRGGEIGRFGEKTSLSHLVRPQISKAGRDVSNLLSSETVSALKQFVKDNSARLVRTGGVPRDTPTYLPKAKGPGKRRSKTPVDIWTGGEKARIRASDGMTPDEIDARMEDPDAKDREKEESKRQFAKQAQSAMIGKNRQKELERIRIKTIRKAIEDGIPKHEAKALGMEAMKAAAAEMAAEDVEDRDGEEEEKADGKGTGYAIEDDTAIEDINKKLGGDAQADLNKIFKDLYAGLDPENLQPLEGGETAIERISREKEINIDTLRKMGAIVKRQLASKTPEEAAAYKIPPGSSIDEKRAYGLMKALLDPEAHGRYRRQLTSNSELLDKRLAELASELAEKNNKEEMGEYLKLKKAVEFVETGRTDKSLAPYIDLVRPIVDRYAGNESNLIRDPRFKSAMRDLIKGHFAKKDSDKAIASYVPTTKVGQIALQLATRTGNVEEALELLGKLKEQSPAAWKDSVRKYFSLLHNPTPEMKERIKASGIRIKGLEKRPGESDQEYQARYDRAFDEASQKAYYKERMRMEPEHAVKAMDKGKWTHLSEPRLRAQNKMQSDDESDVDWLQMLAAQAGDGDEENDRDEYVSNIDDEGNLALGPKDRFELKGGKFAPKEEEIDYNPSSEMKKSELKQLRKKFGQQQADKRRGYTEEPSLPKIKFHPAGHPQEHEPYVPETPLEKQLGQRLQPVRRKLIPKQVTESMKNKSKKVKLSLESLFDMDGKEIDLDVPDDGWENAKLANKKVFAPKPPKEKKL